MAIGADFVSIGPDLVDGLMTAVELPSICLVFPVQSINDSIHVQDSVFIARDEVERIFINTGHGIEDFLHSSGLLDQFLDEVYHRRFVSFLPDIIANRDQVCRVTMCVPWLREFEGERQLLPLFADDDVTDCTWHFKKSIVYFKRKNWKSFFESACKCSQLAGADKFWVNDYFNSYLDETLPDNYASGILHLALKYSMPLVDKIIQTRRYERIIFDQVDIHGFAFLGAVRDCVPKELYSRFFNSEELSDLKIILISVLSRRGDVNAIYFLSRYAFELGYYSVADELLSCDLNSVDAAEAWEVSYLKGSVLAAVGKLDESKHMFEQAGKLTHALPKKLS